MVNHDICSRIVKTGLEWYDITESELKEHIRDVESKGRKAEKISVSQALKHIVRDWAKEGEYERVSTFPCVLASLKTITSGDDNMKTPKILVPGAGLGRLGYDIAAAFPCTPSHLHLIVPSNLTRIP
jgi:carnosine N-methyltransferase